MNDECRLMKLKWLAFLLAVFILHPSSFTLSAAEITSATIAVTNSAGTTNGQTITINGVVRTWTNSVQVPAVQILTNSTSASAATNLYRQLASYAVPGGTALSYGSSTSAVVRSFPGQTLTITLSDGWGLVTYTTNTLTSATVVRTPNTVESAATRTNVATGLVDWLNLTAATNQLQQSAPAMAQLLGTTNSQSISGAKTWTGSNHFANTTFTDARATNLANYGNAISSIGANATAEQFGYNAIATAAGALAVGRNAEATAASSVAVGGGAFAYGAASISIGVNSLAQNANDMAIGVDTVAAGTNSIAIGRNAATAATHQNSVAIGYNSATTTSNQIVLGSSGISVVVHNALSVGGGATFGSGVTNLIATGTNSFSDIAFRRLAITSLANGNNAGVIVGTNTFVEVSGPSAAFTLNGMTGSPSRDGHLVYIVNQTGFDWTVAHQSGTDPVAANRIITMTGADRTTTGNGAATFIYSAAAARWLLIGFDP